MAGRFSFGRLISWKAVASCCLVAALLGGLASRASAQRPKDDVSIDATPVFGAANSYDKWVPVDIVVDSRMNLREALLKLSGPFGVTTIPISVRAGERVRFRTYLIGLNGYTATLDTQNLHVSQSLMGLGSLATGSSDCLVITNKPSRWRTSRKSQSSSGIVRSNGSDPREPKSMSCVPARAPDRPVGYQSLRAVILAEGAETLSDDQVSALKDYALMGGHIVTFRGSGESSRRDPRWSTFASRGSSESLQPGELPRSNNALTHRSVTTAGTVVTPFGRGSIICIASNPFREVSWNTDDSLVRVNGYVQSLCPDTAPTGTALVAQTTTEHGLSSQNRSVISRASTSDGHANPFLTRLPAPGNIFGLMAGFFLLVVPVNFLVLKFFRRAEWAWYTAPVLSLAFAGAVFSLARGLYTAKLCATVHSTIFAQEGEPDSIAVGRSEMFFPSAGSYDLKLRDVDSIEGTTQFFGIPGNDAPGAQRIALPLEIVDTGSMTVPLAQVGNLSFRAFDFRQRIRQSPWI